GVGHDAEQVVGHVDRARATAGRGLDVELHSLPPVDCATGRLAAFLTNTSPPLGPGTAPFTRRMPRSGSPSTTSRFWVVMRPLPYWPAIFMPLNTRAGVAHAPTEPGERCFLWLPCDAPWPLKLCRCIAPEKPLPLLMPVTSTRSPAPNTSAPITCPTSNPPRSSTRSSARGRCAGASAFLRCPSSGFERRWGLVSPNESWTAE